MTASRRAGRGVGPAAVVALAVLAAGCADTGSAADGATPAGPAAATSSPDATSVFPAAPPADYDDGSVLAHLTADGRFDILLGILEEHEPGLFLQEFGRTSWPHTFFAPTDAAFEALDVATAEQLLADQDLLTRLLRYHVVPGRPRPTAELEPGSVATLSGPLEIAGGTGGITVGGVRVVEPDVDVAGGVVHVVDQLIVPCDDPLVQDRELACVPARVSPAPERTVTADEAATMTIAEVLWTDERFDRWREVVERTRTPVAENILAVWDWEARRMGDDRDGVTVFVPTDAAFEALDPDVLAVIEETEDNDLLYALFGHHYVHRLYPSGDFEPGPQRTWNRSPRAPIELTLEPLSWGGQPIVATDLRTANGIIHVVAGVVIPDGMAAAADERG